MKRGAPMTPSITARLPWALLALDLLLVVVHLLLVWRISRAPGVEVYKPGLVALPTFVAFVAVGALIALRHPENRFGWLLCGIGLSWEAWFCLESYASYANGVREGELIGSRFAVWIASWQFFPNLGLVVAIVPLLFPSGRPPSGRWRLAFWLALVGIVCATAGFMFESTRLEINGLPAERGIANPYGIDHGVLYSLFLIGFPLTILSALAAGASIVSRLRHARGVEQQQLKWVAYAGALIAAIFGVDTALFIFGHSLADPLWYVQLLSFAAFPISAGIAIVRYRLFDIDVLIRRTLVYGLLTVSLVLAYLALILSSQSALRAVVGQRSDVATAAATLGVAALFRPLRARVQSIVDRRFYRRRFDSAQLIGAFSARLREEMDLPTLVAELHGVVQETMQPSHVSLWLRPPESRVTRNA